MSNGPNIQVEPGFSITATGGQLRFFNRCIAWANALHSITGGGISMKIETKPGTLAASFWWRGKEIANITSYSENGLVGTRYDGLTEVPVTVETAWQHILCVGLYEAVNSEMNKMIVLRGKVGNAHMDPTEKHQTG